MAMNFGFLPVEWLDQAQFILEEVQGSDPALYVVYKSPDWFPVTRVNEAEMFLNDYPNTIVIYDRGGEPFAEYNALHIGSPDLRENGVVKITVVEVVEAQDTPVEGAVVTLVGDDPVDVFDAVTTGANGVAEFTVKSNTFTYTVNKTGYDEETGEVNVFAGTVEEEVTIELS